MIILIALDDKNGMVFNHRRQSQDEELRKRILEIARGKRLWMNSYSSRQFAVPNAAAFSVSDTFLKEAGDGDYCFVEDCSLNEYLDHIEQLIVFRWNRVYPSDMKLDIPLNAWKLMSSNEFPGKSHKKITEEVYVR